MTTSYRKWLAGVALAVMIVIATAFYSSNESNEDLPFTDVSAQMLQSRNLGYNSMDGQAIDIDQDGDLDMIIAVEFRRNVLLINDGTGRLVDESNRRFPESSHDSEDVAVADFDGDGDLDIVFVSEDDETNEYYENNGKAMFKSRKDMLPTTGISNAVEAMDLNGDGLQDLIIGNAGQNVVLINDGGRFRQAVDRLPVNGYTTQDLELGDVDGDGDLDLLEGNETYNRLLLNDGKGFFVEAKAALPRLKDQTRDADFGDVDGDGDLDIVFSNVDFGGFGNPQNRLLLNDGTGVFVEVTDSYLPRSPLRTVDSDLIDIDQDGDLDLVCGNRWNGLQMMVLTNDGVGHFHDHSNKFFPSMNCYPFYFQTADFNGDGENDLYICCFRGDDILLFASDK